jgi:hypothetical protein
VWASGGEWEWEWEEGSESALQLAQGWVSDAGSEWASVSDAGSEWVWATASASEKE